MVRICLIAAVLCMLCLGPASAARIYNELPRKVMVEGGRDGNITLDSGAKSASLNWNTHYVKIYTYPVRHELCDVVFGYAGMSGGHYLIIGHNGPSVSCYLCDSNYKTIKSSHGEAPASLRAEFAKAGSSKQGC